MSSRILAGLLSITFRRLSWEQVVQLILHSGLSSIEWGGDIHVPPGDITHGSKVRRRCDDHGILISAYGSYYRCSDDPAAFASILDTALTLGTDTIRVWAGSAPSKQMSAGDKQRIADDLHRCCALAAPHGITIATEFHANTLTDDANECMKLIAAAGASNLRTFWQPPNESECEPALGTLRLVKDKLSNIHVFHWWPTTTQRQALETGRDRWKKYLAVVDEQGALDHRQRFASLEFVRADDVEQFKHDAATLIELIAEVSES